MIMPLYDDNSDRKTTPYINYTLIALNVLIFVGLQQLGANWRFTYALALVPEEIITGKDLVSLPRQEQNKITGQYQEVPGLQKTPISPYITLLTSIFLHGSIMHLLGNMLFLWIFGDNLEDEMGHFRYLLFYLICGLAAGLIHVASTVLINGRTDIPCLGASGAISGVLGGYMLLHPQRRVVVLILRIVTEVPAWVAIGLWFLFQLIEAAGALGRSSGVAYSAHIGGFLVGLALVKLFTMHLSDPWKSEKL